MFFAKFLYLTCGMGLGEASSVRAIRTRESKKSSE